VRFAFSCVFCLLVSKDIGLNMGEKPTEVLKQVVFNKSLAVINSFSQLEQAMIRPII